MTRVRAEAHIPAQSERFDIFGFGEGGDGLHSNQVLKPLLFTQVRDVFILSLPRSDKDRNPLGDNGLAPCSEVRD